MIIVMELLKNKQFFKFNCNVLGVDNNVLGIENNNGRLMWFDEFMSFMKVFEEECFSFFVFEFDEENNSSQGVCGFFKIYFRYVDVDDDE